jgi:hypothetical protein
MGLEQNNEQHYREVVDTFIDPVISTQMANSDYVVRPSATSAIIITLPLVAEAKGRIYSIYAALATSTNTITITDANDSEDWTDVVLDGTNQGRLFYSDGRRWCIYSLSATGTDVAKSSALTTGAIRTETVALTLTGASTDNQVENFRAMVTANVKTGQWVNAGMFKIDFSTAGYVVGLAGVVCAELDMPGGAIPGGHGTYTCYEAEINLPTSYSGGGVPVSFFCLNVWGAQVAQFDTSGLLFDISGVTIGSGKFCQANTAGAATHALKCRINGTLYYVMLTTTGA